ncbi:MAG: TRAP transporter small permease [Syntrophomonadaceae bacterium]|jgi:TRAP-type C4-dicarboxylate transport system permease small subunit|nr:TRAP transporter small permease [Syntrophomonadaceae bacterium]
MASTLNKFNNFLGSIEYAITVPIFLAMLTLMFVQVIFRYFLESPLPWSEEIIRYAFIASSYLGGAIATMEREHIEINFIEIMLEKVKNTNPQKHAQIIKIANAARDLLAAFFLSMVVYQTYLLVADQFNYSMVSPAAQVPMWIVTGFMLLGLIMMIIHSLLNVVLNLNGYGKTGYEDPEEGGDCACSL